MKVWGSKSGKKGPKLRAVVHPRGRGAEWAEDEERCSHGGKKLPSPSIRPGERRRGCRGEKG